MCGRFDLDASLPEIREIIKATDLDFRAGEIFPTNTALVLTADDRDMKPDAMVWGFPKFGQRKGVVFNARADTALKKPMFRKALIQNRVVIPTSGFYEWKTMPSMDKKARFLFKEPGQEITWLAGFFNIFQGESRFTMLTTNANDGMAEYHDRMPIVLHKDERLDWLQGDHLDYFLKRVPPELDAKRV